METPQIIELTQGHLEAFHEAFRPLLQEVSKKWGETLVIQHQGLKLKITLAPPNTHANVFYAAFLRSVVEHGGKVALQERYGWMVRSAITSGWLVDAPWLVDEVPRLSSKVVTWLGRRLDEVYSDYDFDVDRARVEAAIQAKWFGDEYIPLNVPTEIEHLARQVSAAYREATEIPPE